MAHWLAASRAWQLCGTCFELRGPFVWRLKGEEYSHVQECACERDRRGDDERPQTWRGFDFNSVAELCRSCGCEVLDSGSRFSVWFCGDCQARAIGLNREIAQPLVPIGRHSIMMGVGLRTNPAPTDAEVETFAVRFVSLLERVKKVGEWGPAVARRNLMAIGRDGETSVPLPDYLEAVRGLDRAERFETMVESMRLDRPSD